MQLTPHFSLEEMTYSQTAARQGINNTPTPEIVEQLRKTCQMLEIVRSALGDRPIFISSGYRSPAVNAAVGGSSTSQHMTGQAADFTVSGLTPKQTVDAILKIDPPVPYDQIIYEYAEWVHMSQAPNPRQMALTIDNSGTRTYVA